MLLSSISSKYVSVHGVHGLEWAAICLLFLAKVIMTFSIIVVSLSILQWNHTADAHKKTQCDVNADRQVFDLNAGKIIALPMVFFICVTNQKPRIPGKTITSRF